MVEAAVWQATEKILQVGEAVVKLSIIRHMQILTYAGILMVKMELVLTKIQKMLLLQLNHFT
jgi:hypothetical protein